MGNKINPLGLRLGINKTASVRWYASKKNYPKLIAQDEAIRALVMKEAGSSGIARIEIDRAATNISVTIYSAKPGVVIGKGGEAIKELRLKLERSIKGGTVAVNVSEVPNANTNATLIAQRVAEQIERRFAFRRALKQAVQRTMESGAQGVKVRISGRLGGAEQARPEWAAEGRVPLQTLRADIDYGTAEASTTYGILGIKAWVFNGEIVGDQRRRAAILPRTRKEEDKDKNRNRRRRPGGRPGGDRGRGGPGGPGGGDRGGRPGGGGGPRPGGSRPGGPSRPRPGN
jgi:small subunit ribosomal protein S3